MITASIATVDDYSEILPFYAAYFPEKHPLFHAPFWEWMFTNPEYGQCIIAKNEFGEIVGHVGAVKGGGLVWLVNILINRQYSGKGVVSLLFETARKFGDLGVAVANESGSGLLRKKKWIEHDHLRRMIWIHPSMSGNMNASLFIPLHVEFMLPKAEGYFWEQPFLESVQLPWGDVAAVSRRSGGIRWVTVDEPDLCAAWAEQNNILWMDWVGDTKNETASRIAIKGWRELPEFPWFLDPLDLSRKVELNLFTEKPIPEDLRFLRTYADMTRVGMIP